MNMPRSRILRILGLASASLAALSSFDAVAAWQRRAWPPPLQKVKPDSPPLSPADSQKTFFMPPGYSVELVASEPMVIDPVAIDFDLEGRMYVVEMLGFMPDTSGRDSREPIGRIVILEDENDDGAMDRRTVFLDKLILPRSVKVLDRGVLVAEPPNLWLARDTNGDLIADTKDRIRSDYGRLEGNPEHNANGLHWGLDNVIYTSEHTYHLELKNGEFRVQPTLSRGQWGLSSDDAGRIYRNWNEQPLFADIVASRYYMRNPNLARTRGLYEILMDPKDMTVWPVRPTFGINRGYREGMLRADGSLVTYVSAGTPTIYRGDRLPRELYGNAFVTESAGNLVHRLTLHDDGTGRLEARNAYAKGEFLASSDERFRPVNLLSGPDGTLYVVDMYRGVIQDGQYWTDYLRDYIKKNDLELPVGLGRIWRVVHESTTRDRKPSLTRETADGLVALLAHPNGWHRDTAQRLLVERAERSAVPALQKITLGHADWRARLHALWTLDGLEAIDAATVTKALADVSPEVRASGIRLAERWFAESNHPIKASVLSMIDDANWTVRRQLAASIGNMPAGDRLDAIASILRRYGRDAITVDAAISGIPGQELEVLTRLLQQDGLTANAPILDDAVAMLAAAGVRGGNTAALTSVLEVAGDAKRVAWQRVAVLRGADHALGVGGRRGGRGRGGGASDLAGEPVALLKLAATPGELGALAGRVAARLSWPGKPAPPDVTPLTPDEQKRFAQGREVYKNLCVACHQPDGRGVDKVAPTLVNSRNVIGNPGIPARIVLDGKEGSVTLMPPLGASLTDEQTAAVLTYIRREWGHAASAVTAAEVKEVRDMTSTRKRPWTEEEIRKLSGGSR
jgi:mono/diheme cytochrome c family protein/glucose/arabinose dehydrogenase